MSDMNVKHPKPLWVAAPRRAQFSRIRNLRAFEEIADQIRKELSDRRLRAGRSVAAGARVWQSSSGVRNTLREALRSLENAGFAPLAEGCDRRRVRAREHWRRDSPPACATCSISVRFSPNI